MNEHFFVVNKPNILHEVEREGWGDWARQESHTAVITQPMKVGVWGEAPLHALARGMVREIRSLVP